MGRLRSRTHEILDHGADWTVAEFFAGMGLVRRALESPAAGGQWRTAYANDISPVKARLYRAWFPDGAAVMDERDIHAVAAADVPPAALWTASFPCTDLSLAGRGAGIHAGQSGAVWRLLELLREKGEARPEHVLFENVLGLLTSHGGADLRALVAAMNGLGYGVDPMMVDAAHFTPQSRPRVFLVCTRLDSARAPERADVFGLAPCSARPRRVVEAMRAHADLVWHARELPPLPRKRGGVAAILEDVPRESERWWSRERAAYFLQQMHPAHVAAAQRMIEGDEVSVATAFRRIRPVGPGGEKRSVIELRTDGFAGCLRTPKGGSAKQIVFVAGRGEFRVRNLTALECARLQGVDGLPEGFTETELLFALGDAVCVGAVGWVAGLLAKPVGARHAAPVVGA